MLKNTAGQKLIVFAFNATTNLPVSGDAANITAYVSKDFGTVTVLGDTSATEMDATNAKGSYLFDLTQAETNADTLHFTAKSSTANIVVVGVPATVATLPVFGTPAGASMSADIAAIMAAVGASGLATKTADAGTLTTGSVIGGLVTDTASDNDTYWITAPVTPAVGGFGLRQQLRFDLPLGRIPVSLFFRGYWTAATGRVVDVYALNSRTATYDKLTNTGTNLVTRTTETSYSITLPRDYADSSGGSFNIVTLEFRSASTTTTDRLRVDQILVTHLAEDVSTTVVVPTAADIWSNPTRTLTTPGVEPVDLTTQVTDIQNRLPAALVGGRMDASVGAVATDALSAAAVSAAAVTKIQAGLSTLTAAGVRTELGTELGRIDAPITSRLAGASYTAPDNTTITAIAGYLDTEITAIKAKTDLIPAAPAAAGDVPTADENAAALLDLADGVETGITFRQAMRANTAALAAQVAGAATTTVTFAAAGNPGTTRIVATTDADGNRTNVVLTL